MSCWGRNDASQVFSSVTFFVYEGCVALCRRAMGFVADAVVGIVQVGDGSNIQRNSPVAVVGLSSGVQKVAVGGVRLIQTFSVLCCTCACGHLVFD